jgi:hypothetical protein
VAKAPHSVRESSQGGKEKNKNYVADVLSDLSNLCGWCALSDLSKFMWLMFSLTCQIGMVFFSWWHATARDST